MNKVNKGLLAAVGTLAVAGLGLGAYKSWPHESGTAAEVEVESGARRIPVVITPARQMEFQEAVVLSGSVEAKNFSLISARLPGPLDAIFVDEGDEVQAGETRLFQTDSLKLTKALAIAQQSLQVAEFSVKEKEASLEQSRAELEQAEIDLARYKSLASDNAVPQQLYDQQATRHRQAAAMVKHAEALLALEQAELEQAHLSLTMAEKDLTDSLVVAPLSGRVSHRFQEPGEMAGAGTPVVKIEDLSVLEISVFLPAEYFSRVRPGETRMRMRVGGISLGAQPVTFKSPTVNPKLRTFEVKAEVHAPPDGVAPGCLAEVAVVLNERAGVGVRSEAIEQRGGGRVLFLLDGESARMTPVETGLEADGWIEIIGGEVAAEAPVITMGQQMLEDGSQVSIAKELAQ